MANLSGSGTFTVNGGNGAGGRISGVALFAGRLQAAGGVKGGTGGEGGQAGTKL